MATANVVYSGPADDIKPLVDEAIIATGQVIRPGHLVVRSSGQWINHNSAGNALDYRIADVDFIRNRRATDALDAGDTAQAFIPVPGQAYNIIVGASQTVAVGSPLTSNGNGTVRIAVVTGATPDVVMFYSEEALTTGAGATAQLRARVSHAGSKATA
jgi:hypothetical protein